MELSGTSSEASRIRVLSLHGVGTNSEVRLFGPNSRILNEFNLFRILNLSQILSAQTCDKYDFDFVDGEYEWPAARGVRGVFGDQFCYSYHEYSAPSVLKALQDITQYIQENGPFDAVMGFSMGGGLAITLLLYHEKFGLREPPFRFGILLCSARPFDLGALHAGRVELLAPEQVGQPVRIPTIHFWSPKDDELPGESSQSVQICDPNVFANMLHHAGHAIPNQPGETAELVQAIRELSNLTCH